MVLEINQSKLEYSVQNIEAFADALSDWRSGRGQNTIDRAVKTALKEGVQSSVLATARKYATPHVGSTRAQDIETTGVTGPAQDTPGRNVGDKTYTAGLETSNVVVMSHETGSGQYTTRGKYEITPTDPGGVLVFEYKGKLISTKLVKHPGVRGKRFMYRAIREEADAIARKASDEAQQTLADAIARDQS